MKNLFVLALFFYCSTVIAEPEAPQTKFRALDKDGDNKISASEADHAPWFKIADKDNDGWVTETEGRAFMQLRAKAKSKNANGNKQFAAPNAIEPAKKLDVRYHETPGVEANSESLDLYFPANPMNAPILIYVHGGGWQKGDKSAIGSKASFYTSQGWLVASINYRLIPAGKHPNNVQDVANATAWIHSHATEHGGDPNQIVLMGHSAGAHLVALVATGESWLKNAGKSLDVIKGVVELDTQALDVVKMMSVASTETYEKAFGTNEAVLRDASPFEHISKGKSIPPFMLVVAGGLLPKVEQAQAFQAKLREAGVHCEFIEAPQHDHGSLNQAMGVPNDKTHEAVWNFVVASLREANSKSPAKER